MKCGEIWSVSGAAGYGSKPRPALILQSDTLAGTKSVITCGFTTLIIDGVPFRPLIEPTPKNGLHAPSSVMADKMIAVQREKAGQRIGQLSAEDMALVEEAMLLVLGFAG